MNSMPKTCRFCVLSSPIDFGVKFECKMATPTINEHGGRIHPIHEPWEGCRFFYANPHYTFKAQENVNCFRCRAYIHYKTLGIGICYINKNSTTILGTCPFNQDQGFNVPMDRSQFKKALTMGLHFFNRPEDLPQLKL